MTEAYSNAYDDLRGTVPAAGADWDGSLTAGLYTVGQDLPEGTYTIQCAEGNTSIDLHIVSDEYGVEIYEDLSTNGYDAIDSERDDVPLPAGTVLFLSGNGTLYFHSSNAQVDALPTETAPNPLVSDAAYTLSDSDESLYLLVGEDIEPGVYDATCTAGTGYFSFVLPMENTRTMYCSAWLYGDPDYVDTLRHITLTEDTEVTLSNYSDMDFTVTLTPSETVYVHGIKNGHSKMSGHFYFYSVAGAGAVRPCRAVEITPSAVISPLLPPSAPAIGRGPVRHPAPHRRCSGGAGHSHPRHRRRTSA